ncbi:MAG: O-antigen ligase family protein [Acidiferrobacteraceae bacterium]
MEATRIRHRGLPAALREAPATPWAHRLALLSMFVYIAKVANFLPVPGHVPLGKVLIGATIVMLVLEGGGWWDDLSQDRVIRPYLWLLGLAAVTLPFGIWRSNSLHFLEDYYKDAVLAFLLIATTRTEADLRRLIWAFVINTLILTGVLFRYGDTGVGAVRLGKNEIAMTAVMAFGLALPMSAPGIRQILKWGAMVVLVAGVLHSNSRGSYLGVAAVAAMYLYRRLGGRALMTVVACLGVAFVTYLLLPAAARATIETLIHYHHDYDLTSPQGRIAIWGHALHIIAAHPLTGVGIGNFPVAEGQLAGSGEWMDAHNAALQVAAEIGLPALIAFVLVLARMWGTGIRIARREGFLGEAGNAVFYGTWAYIVTAFFLSQGLSAILYVLLAIAVSAHRIEAVPDRQGSHVLRS